jgi:zinc D-Ala-D-Ala carboxypeptidase
MNLSPHFTVEEFTASDTASRRGIDNSLPATLLVAAGQTCDMLERIRDRLSQLAGVTVPIEISSGYRCHALNQAVGSADTSDHPKGMAADFKAPTFGSPLEVCQALAPLVSDLEIGQLIYEYGRWIHVSTRRPDKQINRIITISQRGTEVGVLEV